MHHQLFRNCKFFFTSSTNPVIFHHDCTIYLWSPPPLSNITVAAPNMNPVRQFTILVLCGCPMESFCDLRAPLIKYCNPALSTCNEQKATSATFVCYETGDAGGRLREPRALFEWSEKLLQSKHSSVLLEWGTSEPYLNPTPLAPNRSLSRPPSGMACIELLYKSNGKAPLSPA